MIDITQIKQSLTEQIDVLEFEVSTLNKKFQETNFFGNQQNFPNAHWGYLMVCMSKIDLISLYWKGGTGSKQTKRMISFMNKYLHPDKNEENCVAVQMFRHTLMHTGELRFLYDVKTNSAYTWRVHFGYSLPSPYPHYSITVEDKQYQQNLISAVGDKIPGEIICKSLNFSLLQFVSELKRCLQQYLIELEADGKLQKKCIEAHQSIIIQKMR